MSGEKLYHALYSSLMSPNLTTSNPKATKKALTHPASGEQWRAVKTQKYFYSHRQIEINSWDVLTYTS